MKNMLRIAACILCMCIFIFPEGQVKNNEIFYEQLFKKADSVFTGESDEYTDSIALNYLNEVIAHVSPSRSTARLLYNSHERAGIFQMGLGYNSSEILKNFYTAFNYHRQYHLPDSMIFRLLLSTGNVHYNNSRFDSTLFYFSKAETIIEKYPYAGLAGDLYNSLGALYSESGDYKQSSIYFSKALEITKKTRPELNEAIFAMSLNIASALKLSGHLDSALLLYRKLLTAGEPLVPLLHNIAGIYLLKKIPDSALIYLNQMPPPEGSLAISVNNAFAQAWLQKNDPQTAIQFLQKAAAAYKENFAGSKNAAYSHTNKLMGDVDVQQQKLSRALNYYQAAIIHADYRFNDTSVYSNPGNFTRDFAGYSLFEAMLAKANCFTLLYDKENKREIFNAAISTFDSAFVLADYIKISIDDDEARLFIADKVFYGYRAAVEFILAKQNEHTADSILLKALTWISKSRATSLAISLRENSIKRFAGLPDSLLQKERNIKISLSRLKLYMQQTTDSATVTSLVSEIGSKELELQQLQNTYRKFSAYYNRKFAADSFNINALQSNIPDKKTAIAVYFTGEKNFSVFVITQSGISYFTQPADSTMDDSISTYISALSNFNGTQQKKWSGLSFNLYNKLVSPISPALQEIHSIIIIPDRQLIRLPFEALLDEEGKYVAEKYSITYQYALPFLHRDKGKADLGNVTALAPFASHGANNYDRLVSSSEEIAVFDKETQLLNESATKEQFIKKAKSVSVIHLATHAVVDFDDPSASFVTFYPLNKADSSYKIFAHELYNLELRDANLVFLSACETGTGKISQSEGALSLSRAFSYAGCENIITSLWKAEDRSTAYISKRFYHHLEKGSTYADALRQAKTDLLNDASMSQYHSPQYWSHLIFIGEMQEQSNDAIKWLLIIVALLAVTCLGYKLLKKKSLKENA